jgi:signal transduction histidine kinase/CheY-like chemotaxis protein
MSDSVEASELPTQLLSDVERSRVLSATRLKLTLTVFVVAILLGLSTMIFFGVSRIFDWLTPSIRADLQHKAQRGALELAQTTQYAMVVRDVEGIRKPCRDYLSDEDVLAIRVLDDKDQPLLAHGASDAAVAKLLASKPNIAHDLGTAYGAWSPSLIEGADVGRVALVLSKARLEAGMDLRRQILISGGLGCMLALALCLAFVSAYIGPILRVTTETFIRLEHTTEAALAAARLKSQFLANMSHEIRTPMNGIIGVLDLLHRTELTAKQQRYTDIIDASARGLLTIINDVLDFSKLEAGKYVLCSSDFDLRQLMQEVAELLSPRAHDKKLELITRIEPNVPQAVHGDMDRVKQVLTNLVGNAIKFTDQGYVEMQVSVAETTADGLLLRFGVRDTGPGIKPDDQTRLFGEFTQVDGSMTRKHGGTGLGLAISKQLSQAMGGSVGLESSIGEGSTFWFTIATRASQGAPEPLAKLSADVLVVCPLDAQSNVVRELLERWGMHCTIALNPAQACELVQASEGAFDVALVDGACDGVADEGSLLLDICIGEGLPVVHMLSTADMARHAGSDTQRNYLLKPLRASELYNGLQSILIGGSVRQTSTKGGHADHETLPEQRKTRVLVVDDNDINRLVAVDLLVELGYPADTACNGLEAVIKAKSGIYGVILMDCQMPELDGFGATRKIRTLPEPMCKVPIIALTAHALAGDRERVLAAGMDDYTTKPIRVRTLEQLLLRWGPDGAHQPIQPLHQPTSLPANTNAVSAGPQVSASTEAGLTMPELDMLSDLDMSLPRSKTVVELYLKTMPALLESLDTAMQQQDAQTVKQLAHKVKGNCLSLGAVKLATTASAIEQAAARGLFHQDAFECLPALFSAVSRALELTSSGKGPNEMASTGGRNGTR